MEASENNAIGQIDSTERGQKSAIQRVRTNTGKLIRGRGNENCSYTRGSDNRHRSQQPSGKLMHTAFEPTSRLDCALRPSALLVGENLRSTDVQ